VGVAVRGVGSVSTCSGATQRGTAGRPWWGRSAVVVSALLTVRFGSVQARQMRFFFGMAFLKGKLEPGVVQSTVGQNVSAAKR